MKNEDLFRVFGAIKANIEFFYLPLFCLTVFSLVCQPILKIFSIDFFSRPYLRYDKYPTLLQTAINITDLTDKIGVQA